MKTSIYFRVFVTDENGFSKMLGPQFNGAEQEIAARSFVAACREHQEKECAPVDLFLAPRPKLKFTLYKWTETRTHEILT